MRLLLDVADAILGHQGAEARLKLSSAVPRMQPDVLQPVTITVSTRSLVK